jgi:putative beta-barrel porin BBP2
LLCAARTAPAQTGVDEGGPDPATVRMRVGPLWMNPRVELKNLGIDTNVFNQPDDQNPKSDFTFTLTPALDAWLRVGRSWLQSTIREDLVYYRDYSSERSTNEMYSLSWRVPVNRVSFSVEPNYVSTRERPGYEIDARVHRTEWGSTAGIEVRALSKTSVGVTGSYKEVDFDQNAAFLGTNLHDELNRSESAASLSVRHQLTPLTALGFSLVRQRDRFTYSPSRDADSTQIVGNATFDPHALLKGDATLGYRDYHPLDATVPGYTGFIGRGDLAYTLLEVTRFQVQFKRDITYSYDGNQPYYLEGGVNGSIAQQVFGPIDVTGRAGRSSLAYRDRTGAAITVPERVDYVRTYGGGVGYHLGGGGTRIGFNIDHYSRASDLPEHRYNGLRYGASVTYGF